MQCPACRVVCMHDKCNGPIICTSQWVEWRSHPELVDFSGLAPIALLQPGFMLPISSFPLPQMYLMHSTFRGPHLHSPSLATGRWKQSRELLQVRCRSMWYLQLGLWHGLKAGANIAHVQEPSGFCEGARCCKARVSDRNASWRCYL